MLRRGLGAGGEHGSTTPSIKSLPGAWAWRARVGFSRYAIFGIFKLADEAGDEQTLYWKIDYYDLAVEFGSEDAADPKRTLRVLTIMLREEY